MLKSKVALALARAIFVVGLTFVTTASAAELRATSSGYPPEVQPASDEGELALKRFRLPKGLKVELAAAEPLLANPVAFSIDEQGRFYVVESGRLHAGVTDIRGHMDWLDEELASKTVEERVAYITKHEGKRIDDYRKYSDRLRLVSDADGDGKFDTASVFTDGFTNVADGLASGVLARNGDVYFANIPNLWLLRDTNNSGRAGFKKSLSYGYGVRVGFLGHDLHGLRFGPDGKLYFSIGDRGAYVKVKGGKTVENRETGAIYRCDPDGANLEIFCAGLRNPQELAFDQFGNLWTGDNNSDGGDPARWVYAVEGGDTGWRIGWQFLTTPNARGAWLGERMCYPQFDGQAAYILPPIANIGNGPSGLTYYPGTGLNDQYKDRFFLCDFRGGTGSGIHSIGVKPKGAGFEVTERSDFIWDVLVTDGDFGYDGCFYLTDWVNGWNQSGKGRIYRVFDPETRNSPAVLETKKLFAEGFGKLRTAELTPLLAHADQRVRQEAQFALVAKGTNGLRVLTEAASSHPNRLARLHGIWGIGQVSRKSPKALRPLVRLLADADPEVRSQAAKVLGDARASQAYDALVNLLDDPAPRPRYFAAIALSKVGRPEALHGVLNLLRANNDQDRYLRHAGIMALTALADAGDLERLAKDKSTAVRLAAVVALRRQERAEVATFLKDTNALVVLEAARAINDLPITKALPKLAQLLDDKKALARQEEASRLQRETVARQKNAKSPDVNTESDVLYAPLLRRIVNAHFRLGESTNAKSLIAFATSTAPSAIRAEALSTLGDWAKPSGRDNITGLWRPLDKRDEAIASKAVEKNLTNLLQNASSSVKLAAIKVAVKLGLKEGSAAAFTLLADEKQPGNVRTEALKALSSLKSDQLTDAVKIGLASTEESLRNEANRLQAKLRPDDAAAKLRTLLDKGSLSEQQSAFTTLATVPGAATDELFAQWLDKLIAKEVPAALQLDLIAAAGQRADRSVKDKLIRFERARPADDDLRAYRECLEGGNAEAGKKIFLEKQEVACVRCHKAGGEGGEVGPNLAGLAAQKSREYLLESIVYPNKQIAAGFENLLVTMNNGAIYAGLLKGETADEIELNSPEDGPLKLKKSEIKSRERGLSGMPEEIRQILTKQDLRNLIEFLATVK